MVLNSNMHLYVCYDHHHMLDKTNTHPFKQCHTQSFISKSKLILLIYGLGESSFIFKFFLNF
jgi:hypothetical protein